MATLTSPAQSNTTVYHGADKTLEFPVTDVTGAAVDITGWGLEFAVYEDQSCQTFVIAYTTGAGAITILNQTQTATKGHCQVFLPSNDTMNELTENSYWGILSRTDTGLKDALATVNISMKPKVP